MRTTIRMDDRLFNEIKHLAAETRRTLTAVIEDALREVLARRRQSRGTSSRSIHLPVVKGGSLQPGVDLDCSASLLDLLEGTDAPR
jgi:hypothetical protein